MLAAVLQAPRRLELLRRPEPVARRGEARVRVAATAVGPTDLEIYTGRHPGVRLPVVMGHEATGVVEAVGEGVERVRPGQPVLLNPIIECGSCGACVRGHGKLCANAGPFGREMDGSLAEHILLPAGHLYPRPPPLPPPAAPLVETRAPARHAPHPGRVPARDAVGLA